MLLLLLLFILLLLLLMLLLLLLLLILLLCGRKCFAGCPPEQLNGHWRMGHKCELCSPTSLHTLAQAALQTRKENFENCRYWHSHSQWCCFKSLEHVLAVTSGNNQIYENQEHPKWYQMYRRFKTQINIKCNTQNMWFLGPRGPLVTPLSVARKR